jgi:dihydroorotate dehydrogenase (NAD+) catalytic subunit
MKYDLQFTPPVMNAAGMLGFAPQSGKVTDLHNLGAFVTNPVSLAPRTPAHGERMLTFAGGFLLHTGHPNPGLSSVLRQHATRWERSPLPVIVHLLCQNIEDGQNMVKRLERISSVAGVELGLPSPVDSASACALVQAAQGEIPLLVRLPLDQALELGYPIACAVPGVTFSLGAPRGALPRPDGGITHGRLYGPALFPQALHVLRMLVKQGLPVIAGCGVYSADQVEQLLAAGALGVQIDAVLWRGGFQEKISALTESSPAHR